MKNFPFRLLCLVAASLVLTVAALAEPSLAGHPGLKGQALDADGVKAVLLGKKIILGDTRVVIVIAKAGAAQDAFLQSHVAMTTSQFQNHWRRLFMTGGGTAPKIVETEEDAATLAAATPGAVAIVDSAKAGDLAVLAK